MSRLWKFILLVFSLVAMYETDIWLWRGADSHQSFGNFLFLFAWSCNGFFFKKTIFWHILVNGLCLGANYNPEGGDRRAEWKRRRCQAQSGSKEEETQKTIKAKRHFFNLALGNVLAYKSSEVYISLFFLFCPSTDSSPGSDSNSFETNNIEEVEIKVYFEYSAAQDYEGIHKYANTKILEFLMSK